MSADLGRAEDLAKAIAEVSPPDGAGAVQHPLPLRSHRQQRVHRDGEGPHLAHENVKKRLARRSKIRPWAGRWKRCSGRSADGRFTAAGKLAFGTERTRIHAHGACAHRRRSLRVLPGVERAAHGRPPVDRTLSGGRLQRGRLARRHGGGAHTGGEGRRCEHALIPGHGTPTSAWPTSAGLATCGLKINQRLEEHANRALGRRSGHGRADGRFRREGGGPDIQPPSSVSVRRRARETVLNTPGRQHETAHLRGLSHSRRSSA